MFSFHSEQVHMSAHDGKQSGQRNVVHIKNGKGYKEHTDLGPNGRTRRRRRHRLTPRELAQIEKRKFIPQLFRCCRTRTARTQRRV